MADNVSPATGSEPAELSLDDAVARMKVDDDASSTDSQAPAQQGLEASEDDDATAGEPDEAAAPEDDDASQEDAETGTGNDVLIKLDDGSTITVSELKAKASTLETDNARMSQEVASERRELQQYSQQVAGIFDAFVNDLAARIPAEPNPALMYGTFEQQAQFNRETYHRNAQIEHLKNIFNAKTGLEEGVSQLSDVELQSLQKDSDAKLIAANPHLKDPPRYKAAMAKSDAYLRTLSFTDAEIKSAVDPRMRQVILDAAYGKEARENAQKAKAQVKTAMAKTTASPSFRPHANSMKALDRTNAMKRLQKSGSLADAMKLDF